MGRWLAAVLLLSVSLFARPEVAVPPVARVSDLTGTLAAAEVAQFEQLLSAFEVRKGSQIAVLIVATTQPETIEQYGIRVADAWKLGRKGVDDGVLLLVAKDDRKVRIEVGRGLEGALPDIIAKRIIRDDIAPRFKQGDFAGGIQTGLVRMMGVIDGEPLPPAPEPQAQSRESGASGNLEALLVVGVILVVVVGSILRAMVGRVPAAALVGAAAGALAWFIVGMIVVGAVVAVIAFVFTLAGGASARRGRGGWTTGGPGGWSSSGGGFGSGGGGFSGGGGGFGGGGASGDW